MTRTPITRCILALAVSSCLLSAETANPKQPQVKGPKESEAIQAMFASQDPDARIAAAMNLVTKFSETDFKAIALYFVGFLPAEGRCGKCHYLRREDAGS